jgi:hypothetical protein
VYKRTNTDFIIKNGSFQTFRVHPEDISFFNNDQLRAKVTSGISSEIVKTIKEALLEIYEYNFTINEIHDFPGSTKDERIISFPYQVKSKNLHLQEDMDLLITLSIPPEFPHGKLYVDLSSKDMSKNITIDKHDADVLNREELLLPFLELLKANLEDEIPLLLEQPLWKILKN